MKHIKGIALIIFCMFILCSCSLAKEDIVQLQKEQVIKKEKGKNKAEELDLDNNEKRKINVFISNFAECDFKNFDVQNVDDKELITFAVNHNYINNWNLFYTDSGWAKIHENNIEKTIHKYFDKNSIKHQSVSNIYTNIEYDQKHYACPFEDRKYKSFAQVTRVEKIDDKYIGYANVYNYVEDCVGNPYEPIDFNKIDSKGSSLYVKKKVQVVFKEVIENNKKRYILLQYNELGDEKLLDSSVNINNNVSIDQYLWVSEENCCCGGSLLKENRNNEKSEVILNYIRNSKLQRIDLIDYALKYNLSQGIQSVVLSPDETYIAIQFKAECDIGNISFLINTKTKNVATLWDDKNEQISMYNISFKDNDTFYYLVPSKEYNTIIKKYTISENKSQIACKVNCDFGCEYLIKFDEKNILLVDKYKGDVFKVNIY